MAEAAAGSMAAELAGVAAERFTPADLVGVAARFTPADLVAEAERFITVGSARAACTEAAASAPVQRSTPEALASIVITSTGAPSMERPSIPTMIMRTTGHTVVAGSS